MYLKSVEFDSCPPQHEVKRLPGNTTEIIFWRNVRHVAEDEHERWIADGVSMTARDRPGLLEAIEAETEDWFATAIAQSDIEAKKEEDAKLLTPGQIRELKDQNEMYADLIQELAMIVYA